MDGPDLIAVSRLEWPRCLVPRISETDDLVTRVPLQPDGLDLLSGFRDFRSPVSLALRISDSPIPDSPGSLATCPLDQRPMMVSETRISRFRIARDHLKSPICRTPTLWDPLPRVPTVWTAQILSGFSLGFPRALVHGNADFPMANIPIPLRIS
jgi:hypothetical protein